MRFKVKNLAVFFVLLVMLGFPTTVFAGCMPEGDIPLADNTPQKGLNTNIEEEIESIGSNEALFQLPQEAVINNNENNVYGLLGADIQRSKSVLKVRNKRTNQVYVRYELTNGGSIGINELGVVNIDNYEIVTAVQHEKSWDSVIESITTDLNLEDYEITENGMSTSGTGLYRIVWEKQIDRIGTNPYDSVVVVFNPDTFQIRFLERYSMEANATEPQISEEKALEIASTQFDNQDSETSIVLTYARPNTAVNTDKVPELKFEARLSYIVKDYRTRVIVDAITGDIIGCTHKQASARAFGCADNVVEYSSSKMTLANTGLKLLGYNILPKYTLNTVASNQVFIDFLNGDSNYGLYISCHGSNKVLTNVQYNSPTLFEVSYSAVPKGSLWNFVYLDACNTANGSYFSNAFGINDNSIQKAFIGFDNDAYFDDTYNFSKNFWSQIGRKPISECVDFGKEADGCDDLYPVFRGDKTYLGRNWG